MVGVPKLVLLNRLHGGQPIHLDDLFFFQLLNRLHGGQLCLPAEDMRRALLNRLHGGQPPQFYLYSLPHLLNRLHGGQQTTPSVRRGPESSKPPTRRTTNTGALSICDKSSKPPTRRTTISLPARRRFLSSKPPTRRTTRAIRDNIFIFQRITSWHPPIASSASLLFKYFIPKGFSEQLFYEAKRKLQKR